jgi:hypothetical protein
MYGSHYSSPGYVMYWLVRQHPELMLRLQNGRYDAPDRLFFSVGEAWRASSGRSNTDLKELIPEFFLPGSGEFLMNGHHLPLGRRQNGKQVRLTSSAAVHACSLLGLTPGWSLQELVHGCQLSLLQLSVRTSNVSIKKALINFSD